MPDQIGPAEIIARLDTVAAARREYAEGAPEHLRVTILEEAACFEAAKKIAAGDLGPLYGLLQSWRWTPEMHARIDEPTTGGGSDA